MEGTDVCANCKHKWKPKKHSRGFERRGIQGNLRGAQVTTLDALRRYWDYKGTDEGFICSTCYYKLCSIQRSTTRTSAPSTSVGTSSVGTPIKPRERQSKTRFLASRLAERHEKYLKNKRQGIAKRIARNVVHGNYATAIRQILSCGMKAKKALQTVMAVVVRKEVKEMRNRDKMLPVINGIQSIVDFNWRSITNALAVEMPTLCASLKAAMSVRHLKDTESQEKMDRTMIIPRRGLILSVILHTMNPWKFNFLQAVAGIQLWGCGADEKLQTCFNHLGICLSSTTTRRYINRLSQAPDSKMAKWKHGIEKASVQPVARRQDEEGYVEKDVLTQKKSPNEKNDVSTPKGKPSPSSSVRAKIGESNGIQSPRHEDAPHKLGDLVWAKLQGFPWWPAMVCIHPTEDTHFKLGKNPVTHVQFFDNPTSRAWIKNKYIKPYTGSKCKEFEERHGVFYTANKDCHNGAQIADIALKLTNDQRLHEYVVELLPSDEEDDESEENMEVDGNEGDDSKENMDEDKKVEKTPKKSPHKSLRKEGRTSRQAAKRRRIVVESDGDEDSEDDFKPKKGESSDDSISSGVDEASDSEKESEDIESPVKQPSNKRKRSTQATVSRPTLKKNQGGARIKRKPELDSDSDSPPDIPQSPWSQPSASDTKSSPSVSVKTKSKLLGFAAPESVGSVSTDEGRNFPHLSLEFLQPDNIRDAKKRSRDDPDYDPHTLYVPQSFLEKQTPAMRQWWDLKKKNYDSILFFKMGKFYELFHMDAVVSVNDLGLIYMKGEHAHSGFPEIAFARYAETLITKGYKIARIEQTETPDMMSERCKKLLRPTKFDKVVKREVCRITTKGTRVYSFIDGDTTDAKSAYLLAISEKEAIEGSGNGNLYGVCFVDTSIGEFHIGQFEDDRHTSRLRTLVSHYTPAQVLFERGKLSEKTKALLKSNLSTALKESLHSGTEFWDSTKTLKFLGESDYFTVENDSKVQWPSVLMKMKDPNDTLGQTAVEEYDLAVRALGACTWYLQTCCLDQELLSLRKFKEYIPLDAEEPSDSTSPEFVTGRQHMVLDGVTLINLDLVENSTSGGLEGTLLQRLDICSTPFGKRLIKQWLCSPLCNPASINDRLNAMEDIIEGQEVIAEVTEQLKKLPDLERLLSKIHTLGLVRHKDHPDGRAIFFEEMAYSKRKIEDLLSTLNGFKSAMTIIGKFKSISKNFKSTLLQKSVRFEEDEGHFPNLSEQMDFFESAFDQKKAKAQGTIMPNKGVDPEYDQALADMKKTKRELDDYLETQRDRLKCRTISYWGTAKNRFQIEVPDGALKRVPEEYEVTSQKKGFRRYWTDEVKGLLAEMMDAEDRRDAALRDCMRRIFFAFDKSHKQWSAAVQCLAVLDVLISLAQFSRCGDGVMCRPEIVMPSDSVQPFIELREARHPCISRTFSGGDFIPNDTVIGIKDEACEEEDSCHGDSQMVLVTGPNMGGKSTLMRQVGVIVILAQLGCYVPAEKCRLTPVDRVFTRLGASDRIMAGESTFFVELSETSSILQHTTKHSLVLLDELGRGTATYDGTAIACAVVQELSQQKKCRTLFSTHYHSLVEEFSHDPNVRLGHMACMVENENEEDPSQETITFLYKFISGACPKSYGFNAARLADIPEQIVQVAREKAKQFENTLDRLQWFRELFKTDRESVGKIAQLQKVIEVS